MDDLRYLELVRSDSDLLLAAVRSAPDTRVPSCPDWTALDLLRHVGAVYEHKLRCLELDREPKDGEFEPAPAELEPLAAWFTGRRDALLAQLAERGPAQPTYTWFPPDQSVGFWFRRMALETAVHRIDAELAAGRTTPVDPELAADGVDEVVGFLAHDFGDRSELALGADRTVELRCADRRWALTLRTDRLEHAPADTVADASITGDPTDLLLHVWNRPVTWVSSVVESGDPEVLTALRTRLQEESQ